MAFFAYTGSHIHMTNVSSPSLMTKTNMAIYSPVLRSILMVNMLQYISIEAENLNQYPLFLWFHVLRWKKIVLIIYWLHLTIIADMSPALHVAPMAGSLAGLFVNMFSSRSWDGTAHIKSFNFDTKCWTTLLCNFAPLLPFVVPIDSRSEESHDGIHIKVTNVFWTVNDNFILTASTDNIIRIWDPSDGSIINTFKKHSDEIYILTGHPHVENIILSACIGGKAFLWDIYTGAAIFGISSLILLIIEYEYDGRRFLDGHFSPSGSFFALTDDLGACTLFGIERDVLHAYSWSPIEQFFLSDFVAPTSPLSNSMSIVSWMSRHHLSLLVALIYIYR